MQKWLMCEAGRGAGLFVSNIPLRWQIYCVMQQRVEEGFSLKLF